MTSSNLPFETLRTHPLEAQAETQKAARKQEFLRLNAESLAALATFVDFAEGLTIGFVELNFPPDAEILLEALQQNPGCQDIQFAAIDFWEQKDLKFLRDELVKRLQTIEREPSKKLVLVLQNLSQAIGVFGDYPPILQDLNFVRDAYTLSVPHPLLLILPNFAISRSARFAPDFWAWKSGVFVFASPQVAQDEARLQAAALDDLDLSEPVPQERIAELEGLLMEHYPSGRPCPPENWETCSDLFLKLGKAYLSRENYPQAEAYLQESLKFAQKLNNLQRTAESFRYWGYALWNLGRYEKVIASFDKALEIRPDFYVAWNNRGNALWDLGRYEEAIASFDKALEIRPDFYVAWNLRGIALLNLGRHEEAIAACDQALEIKPDDHSAWNLRGIALRDLGRYEEAIASFDKALEIKSDFPEAWNFRGIALRDLGRYEEAIASFDKALEIRPDFYVAWNLRGIALRDLGRYEEAIASYDKALEIQPNDHSAWFCRGIALYNLERYEEAIASFDKALEIQPNDPNAFYSKACCYGLQNNVELALKNLEQAINLDQEYLEMAKTDSDFDSVRGDERFQALVRGSLEEGNRELI
ncbi:MAG: tetratricopeptide repeat protein [Microcoleaceae cyanobacterium]